MSTLHLAVPGNILLLGEYAVLEEGGLGLAMAVEPRVRLEASAGAGLHVEGRWPGGSGQSPLVTAAVQSVSEHLGRSCTGSLVADSTSFFDGQGRKTGLGSSAAVTVALVCGLLRLAGRPPEDPQAAGLCVQAHRRAQAGRGSGYDVLASFHGGVGLFHGGTSPRWEPCRPPLEAVALFAGPGPVSTADAVQRYSDWKARNPGPARDFLRESNRLIRSFVHAASTGEALRSFEPYRRLGLELGRRIGVSAEITCPPGLDPRWCKAVGAGNELGCCVLEPGAEAPVGGAFRVVRAAEPGVAWAE